MRISLLQTHLHKLLSGVNPCIERSVISGVIVGPCVLNLFEPFDLYLDHNFATTANSSYCMCVC